MSGSGSFTTSDGVEIGYVQAGEGLPLVLVHGGATDHRCFDPVVDLLAAHFTVTAYDRRGHGLSAQGADRSLDREAVDLVEMVAFAGRGEPVDVIAYSYGALAALRAVTTRSPTVRSLVAYEAPLGLPGMIPQMSKIVALLDAERHDEAVRLFVGSTFYLPDRVVEAMTAHPMWAVSMENGPGLSHELAEVVAARLDPPRGPVPPVRYLVGEKGGNPAFRQAAQMVKRTIPGADVATVPGLPHFAMSTEPDAFVARALEHLRR